MAIIIWIIMYLTSANSFLCKICGEHANDVEKVVIPLDEEEEKVNKAVMT